MDFGAVHAVNEVAFQVEKPRMVGIIGRSTGPNRRSKRYLAACCRTDPASRSTGLDQRLEAPSCHHFAQRKRGGNQGKDRDPKVGLLLGPFLDQPRQSVPWQEPGRTDRAGVLR